MEKRELKNRRGYIFNPLKKEEEKENKEEVAVIEFDFDVVFEVNNGKVSKASVVPSGCDKNFPSKDALHGTTLSVVDNCTKIKLPLTTSTEHGFRASDIRPFQNLYDETMNKNHKTSK